MKKYLVTGCAGFIGSHLVDRLLAEGNRVVGVDNFDDFYARSIKEHNIELALSKDEFVFREDNFDSATLFDEYGKFDVVIHLAAKAGVRPSIERPLDYIDTNIVRLQRLLDLCVESKCKNFIFASSSSVYGRNENVPWKETDTALKPISPYAVSKISGENMGRVYAHLYDISFTALRFFTVYGPRQRPDLAIHKFVNQIMSGKSISMYGDGLTARDYTYIDDIINGIVGAIENQGSGFDIFNIGNNNTINLKSLIDIISQELAIKPLIEKLPMQMGDVKNTYANIDKANMAFDYRPNTDINNGIRKFILWYKEMKNAK